MKLTSVQIIVGTIPSPNGQPFDVMLPIDAVIMRAEREETLLKLHVAMGVYGLCIYQFVMVAADDKFSPPIDGEFVTTVVDVGGRRPLAYLFRCH